MTEVLENRINSSPLSPEQRALLASMGGEEHIHHAIHFMRLKMDVDVTINCLRAATEKVLRRHDIFSNAICNVSGYRSLRMQAVSERAAVTWPTIGSAEELARFRATPLNVDRGELLRVALFTGSEDCRGLVLVVSALVADRGSLENISACIANACAGGKKSDERELDEAFQYAQYIEWRQELETDDEATAERDYWRHYLKSIDAWVAPRLVYRYDNLSDNKSRLARQRLNVSGRISDEVLASATEVAVAAGVSLEVLLQTVWWMLLARLTGFNPFAVGWQHDCRHDYEVMQGAVGVFDKILPLVIEGSGDESFAAWLTRMSACADSHIDRQEYCPVDTLTSSVHLSIGFAYNDSSSVPSTMPRHVIERPGPMPCFELALVVDVSADGAELALDFEASLYPRQAVERLLSQYLTLLQSALQMPESPMSELPWMGQSEWQVLQTEWRGPSIEFEQQSVAQHIAHWARITPDALAIVAGDQRLSYATLDRKANRLAHWMKAQGVNAGDLVALVLPRSTELIIAMLAAWRIGAGYLPLEPDWPATRRQAVLADACPALVLCVEKSANSSLWNEVLTSGINLDGFDDEPPNPTPRPDDLAYVLYTSGSTGHPKGVVIEQCQLLNYVAAASAAMGLAAYRRWGLVTSVVADLGNTALFGALFNGACLVIASANEVRDGAAFMRFVVSHDIDALKIVPSHLEALLEFDTPRLPRMLVLGGEATPRTLIERIGILAPGCIVYNHYGPTETTVGVMVHRVESAEAKPDVLPLSHVLANNRIFVLDDALRPVPTGGLGVLYIGGAQVCRGYLNREIDDTFIVDPWQPNQRLYRTGDLAWVLPDGVIRLAGRSDHQIKIRGFRVEPAEVEYVLLTIPGIRQAAIIVRSSDTDAELVAFIVSDSTDVNRVSVWREQLAGCLPEHMRPTSYVVLDEFPRLPNGKIDRLVLAAMQATEQDGGLGATPHNPIEATLVKFMADLLKREIVAADADFFELGGHSLLVIRLVARIRKLLQIEIEPGLVFEYPTAQALAAALYAMDPSGQLDQLAQTANT